ncbi:hypothetical protein ES705_36156 [subsurface metagenome]
MTESTKNQLVVLLDTAKMRKIYQYEFMASVRLPVVGPGNRLAYQICLHPRVDCIPNIEEIAGILWKVDKSVSIFAYMHDAPHLVLL